MQQLHYCYIRSDSLSVVSDTAIAWTIQSMEFFRPECWSEYPFPSQGIFPTQGSNPGILHCMRILYHPSHINACVKLREYSKVQTTVDAE